MSKSSTQTTPDLDVPVVVALSQVAELIPSRQPQTIYRWRLPRHGHPPALPAPFAIVARTPLYRLDTILAVADKMGVSVDQRVAKRIRKEQGR